MDATTTTQQRTIEELNNRIAALNLRIVEYDATISALAQAIRPCLMSHIKLDTIVLISIRMEHFAALVSAYEREREAQR